MIIKKLKKWYRKTERNVIHWAWILNARFGPKLSTDLTEKATIIIPSYSLERMKNIEPLTRNLLKCAFVEKIILSNNNPQVTIDQYVKIEDPRVKIINQTVRHGCAYRWELTGLENAEFLIGIDDDLLLFPKQIGYLFKRLVEKPEVPHGLIGTFDSNYYLNREMEVDVIHEIYAISQTHLRRYLELYEEIITRGLASVESIEFWSDDLIISRTGTGRPNIHDAGYILRCKTAVKSGVALYQDEEFKPRRDEVRSALDTIGSGNAPDNWD